MAIVRGGGRRRQREREREARKTLACPAREGAGEFPGAPITAPIHDALHSPSKLRLARGRRGRARMKVLGRKLFLLKGERGGGRQRGNDEEIPVRGGGGGGGSFSPATSMGTLPHCSFSNCRACEARSLVRPR